MKYRDLVIDIGSGDNPNIRADILCDLYPQSNQERSGRMDIWIDRRPFILCDIHKLPFKDKVFDYVLCTHVLEHVQDPEEASKELSRIGKGGMVETPSPLLESLYGWPFHQWRVSRKEDGTVLFERKAPGEQGLLPEPVKKSRTFERLTTEFFSDFHVRFEWKESFSVEVKGKGQDPAYPIPLAAREIAEKVLEKITFRRKVKTLLIHFIRLWITRHTRATLLEIICCPFCRGELTKKEGGFVCDGCAQFFPEIDGILFFHEKISHLSSSR